MLPIMPIDIINITEFPQCPRMDLVCGDQLNPVLSNDLVEATNYIMRLGTPHWVISNPTAFEGSGNVSLGFGLPFGHTHFVLTMEYKIGGFADNSGNRSGVMPVKIQRYNQPTTFAMIHVAHYNISEYLAAYGLGALAYPSVSVEVEGAYNVTTIFGAIPQGLAVTNTVTHCELVFQQIYQNFNLANPVDNVATNPTTGQVFQSGVYGVSFYTGKL